MLLEAWFFLLYQRKFHAAASSLFCHVIIKCLFYLSSRFVVPALQVTVGVHDCVRALELPDNSLFFLLPHDGT